MGRILAQCIQNDIGTFFHEWLCLLNARGLLYGECSHPDSMSLRGGFAVAQLFSANRAFDLLVFHAGFPIVVIPPKGFPFFLGPFKGQLRLEISSLCPRLGSACACLQLGGQSQMNRGWESVGAQTRFPKAKCSSNFSRYHYPALDSSPDAFQANPLSIRTIHSGKARFPAAGWFGGNKQHRNPESANPVLLGKRAPSPSLSPPRPSESTRRPVETRTNEAAAPGI